MTDPAPFWNWFRSEEEKLYQLLGSDLTDVLYDELIKYDSRIGVEVCTDDVVRDVIVTAMDKPAAFDSVKLLIRGGSSPGAMGIQRPAAGEGFRL